MAETSRASSTAAVGRGDAGAPHAEVDIDEHADLDPGRVGRPAQWADMVGMVDGDLDVGLVLERRQPRHLAGTDDQVGDQDVVDPAGGHDLGLGNLGHRHPDRACPAYAGGRSPGHLYALA